MITRVPDLSIILVNWNSEEYLRECIASIYERTYQVSFEVIIVDNASPSGNVDSLKKQFPKIKLVKNTENLGFARANNLGFSHSTGDCILFLNPDTKLNSPAIDIMMREFKLLPEAGVVGCKLLNADQSVQTSSIMKFPRIWNAILQVEYLRLRWPNLWGIGALFAANTSPTKVDAVSGACSLMRREVFEQIGMFSEQYFMYSEDLDLCYKAADAGFTNYYLGCAAIVHYGGRSSARSWQTVMKTRAELHFCEANYGYVYSVLYRLAMVINASARLMVLAIICLFPKIFHMERAFDSAWLRWSVILKTLVTPRGSEKELSTVPATSRSRNKSLF